MKKYTFFENNMTKFRSYVLFIFTNLTIVICAVEAQEDRYYKDSLGVDLNTVIQDDFLGIGSVYHGFSYMPESEAHGMNDAYRKTEFDRVGKSGLKIVRTWYGSDWGMPVWGEKYDWNSPKMNAFYKWLQKMKDMNIDVAINAGWWFTAHTYSNGAPKDGTPNAPNEEIYTKWVSESLNQLIKVKGFTNVKYIFAFTEPGDYCGCGTIPEGFTQLSYYKHVLTKLDAKLKKDGRRNLVKIVGPNAANAIKTREWLQYCKDNLNDVIDIYSSHDYSLNFEQTYTLISDCQKDIASTGKPFWYDEYGYMNKELRHSADYGTYIGALNTVAINAKVQSTQMWLFSEQYYPWPLDKADNGGKDPDPFNNGMHQWGVMPWIPKDQSVWPSYYVMGMMGKYLGGRGTKTLKTSEKTPYTVKIAATKLPDGNYSIIITNTNAAPRKIIVNLSSAINKSFYRHLYDPGQLPAGDVQIGISKTINSVNTTFSDVLPAGGVVIYTTIKD